ncbi:LamG domain-containing protein [Candidatus Dojkabacteria bacterium]|jgi:hypothetical protein|nr:LamG domain-containing protein [Candidatus Dojkabacteria bacterium]
MRYPSRQSEQVLFRELFWNTDSVRDNSGTLVASPTVANGITLNGTTQYATYPTTGLVLNGKTALTLEFWFSPSFNCNDNISRMILDTTSGAGARIFVLKYDNNSFIVSLGNTQVATISLASYQAYWKVGAPNHVAICAASGSTIIYLNNIQIGTSATAWTQTGQPAYLYLGVSNGAASYFPGTIHSLSIYSVKWDANEVSDAYNKCTFTEMAFSKAVVHLPCKSIYANTGDGAALGIDMDMETAGVAAWTPTNSTLTKEAGARTGGSGSLILRNARTAGGSGYAAQNLITNLKYYRCTGWARTDGSGVAAHVYIGGVSLGVVASTNTWTYFDKVSQGTTGWFTLVSLGGADTNYTEWDDVTLQEVDFLTENLGTGSDVKVGDSGLYGVTQAPYNGFVYDGANSYLDCGSDVVGTSAGTFAALVNLTGVGEGARGRIFDNGKFFFLVNVSANMNVGLSSDGATYAFSATNSLSLGNWNTVIGTRTGAGATNLYVNGVLSGTANQSSGTPVAGTTNLIIGNNAGRSITFNGTIKYPKIATHYIANPTQVREIHNKLMMMITK